MRKTKSYKLKKLTLSSVKRSLTVGENLKYCKLCEVLGQQKYTGGQKNTQLKEFARYFDFKKNGMYFLITNIHSKVSEPVVKKIRSDATYPNLIGYLLFNDIANTEGKVLNLTWKRWWLRMNMVNREYLTYASDPKEKKKLKTLNERMTIDDINNFFHKSEAGIYRIFKNALASLEKRGLITAEVVYTVVAANGRRVRPLDSPKNKKIWLQTQQAALDKLGLRSMAEIQYYPESVATRFYKIVNQLRLEQAGWKSGCTSLEITLTEKGLKEADSFNGAGVAEVRQQLNDAIRTSINKQIVSRNLTDYDATNTGYLGDDFNEAMKASKVLSLNLQLLLSDKLLTCHN